MTFALCTVHDRTKNINAYRSKMYLEMLEVLALHAAKYFDVLCCQFERRALKVDVEARRVCGIKIMYHNKPKNKSAIGTAKTLYDPDQKHKRAHQQSTNNKTERNI